MNRFFKAIITICCLTLVAIEAAGAPADLQAWESWLLENQTESRCPWRMADKQERLCSWPGKLALTLSDRSLAFVFAVEVFADQALIPLPGDAKRWPNSVNTNGKPARLVEKKGVPYVSLNRGAHEITGLFSWAQKPQSIRVPESIAIVTLTEAGRERPVNRRAHQLVFSTDTKTKRHERDSLSVEVYRLVKDGVPVTMETRVKLSVGGKPREITLGRLSMEHSVITKVQSRLPAKVEEEGDLRVQVVAGEHHIRVHSRFASDIDHLGAQRSTEHWPDVEYISFQANTDIRQVKLSGATSVDTTQISIPADWVDLPTYRIDKNTALQIETSFRGDHTPLANQLTIKRDLWLDFDGNALTSLDSITGRMSQGWRLNVQPDTSIGRATVAGLPVLITDDQGAQGVEIRSPEINLQAVTRIRNPGKLSATGWDAPADQYQATLHLPPAWRVLHASGVDGVYGTWISQWDLWDIFLLLIMVAATQKLLGLKVAALAAFALLLGFHESGSPIAGFPALLLVIALLSILTGRWKKSASVFGLMASALLVISVVAFAVSTFRLAIYPTLEKSQVGRYELSSVRDGIGSGAEFSRVQQMTPALRKLAPNADLEEAAVVTGARESNLYQVDESDRVQTGPGLPTWLWNRVTLRTSGPVTTGQSLHVVYCPPWLTALWRIASVFLIGAYAGVLVLRLTRRVDFKMTHQNSTAVSAVGLVLTVALVTTFKPASVQAEEFPPQYLLDELESRLMEPPRCLPGCAAMNNGRLVADETQLNLSFDVYADANIALPVPTGRDGWSMNEVTVDGHDRVIAAVHKNQTVLLMSKGHHRVRLGGKIRGDQVSISFPLPIHNFAVDAKSWRIDGLVDGRLPNKILSLRAKASSQVQQAGESTLIPAVIAPFVTVHREFVLGKRWSMVTRVQRLAPEQGPIAVSVGLLPFEKVLSESLRITDGKAWVQFGNRQREISWQSSLAPMDKLVLTASDSANYTETWRFAPSSLWRISYDGIPPVKDAAKASSLQPAWKPWPGEILTLDITRPQGIAGPTQTVEAASLRFQAGTRVQKSKLVLDIRSSIGDDYTLDLPSDAEVLSVARNGKSLNLPDSERVTISLQPGLQRVDIEFQEYGKLGWLSRTPDIQLSGDTSNISLSYELPRDRWPLYVTGPAIGPAMLYWGVLCVIVLGAVILSRLARQLNLDMPIALPGWLLLGLGLSTVNSYGVLVAAVFFFALAARQQFIDPVRLSRRSFNLLQSVIILLTIFTALAFITAIPMGLLSNPDMKVVGNGSYSHLYNSYQDRIGEGAFPSVGVLSVSIMSYRIIMLAWSLWLATRIIQWAQWWWAAYSEKGAWVPKPKADAG